MLRVATRNSALARWQASYVASALGGRTEIVPVVTAGDRMGDDPLHRLGGQGAFVKEVQAAVLRGEADIAVHSAKDLPPVQPDGLVLAAVPPRGDPRDVLVGAALADLPPGALVATGSVRRRAQLANSRPDLTFTGIRGNVGTRLRKLADDPAIAATVVAAAALARLSLEPAVMEVLPTSVLLPQVGQGALAVECRRDDGATRERLSALDDAKSRMALECERAFLGRLGSGCELPVGALAHVAETGEVVLEGLLASLDGRMVLRARRSGAAPSQVGASLGSYLLERAGSGLVLPGPVLKA
ncbi:MAG: hydroxymethylbilane synthase [Acidimicrobiales bacterium]